MDQEARVPPMKVRVIVTKFVEADAVQFKSVVQRLTGKDSAVAFEDCIARADPEDEGRRRKQPKSEELAQGGVFAELLPSLEELFELVRS